jgi:hypothetical protein
MATVTITNLTGNVVLLQELYRNVRPYEAFTIEREEDQLHAMPELQKYWNDGVIQISVIKDSAENNFITTFLHTVGPAALTPNPPISVTKAAAVVGVENMAARGDHKHDVATAPAVEITDSTNAEGIAISLARSDHQHAHGSRGGGALHAVVTTSVAGFMSAADKTRIDGMPTVVADAAYTRTYHEPTITPELGANPPGQQPNVAVIGETIVAEFTPNTDSAYRIFKIPGSFFASPAFHVHWTKESGIGGNGNQFGNSVRWRITYKVFQSTPTTADDINVAGTVIDLDDTYDDSGSTTRLAYRTASVAAAGFVAGYYLSVKLQAVTPAGTALTCEPALISMDLTFSEYINQ